jgi:hypothetical protein
MLRFAPARRNTLVVPFLALALSTAHAETRPPARGRAVVEASVGTATAGALYLAALPPSALESLNKEAQVILGKPTSSSGPALVKAAVRFERPKAEVYALLAQPSEQHTFLPNVKQSRTFGERTVEGESNDFVLAFIFTFKFRTQHWFYPEQNRIEWNLDPAGGDGLVEQLGYWQLYELDEKTTIAEYGTHIVARGAIINFFRGLGERGAIADALAAVRHHVDGKKGP